MSNKKKHFESSDPASLFDPVVVPAEDQQAYNDYIGAGDEAHHPPPTAKKPRLGSLTENPTTKTAAPESPESESPEILPTANKASEDEPPEPKSIDVFGSQPNEEDEEYGTCPEKFEGETEEKEAEKGQKSPEKSIENPEVSVQNEQNEEEKEEEDVVEDSQTSSSSKENSALRRKSSSASFSDDGSVEIGEKFDSFVYEQMEEEEEEVELEIHVKMSESKGSDSSDDRVMEAMREEREMMNTGKMDGKTSSCAQSPVLFSDTTSGSVSGAEHSSGFQSPVNQGKAVGEGEAMEEGGGNGEGKAGNKTMEQQQQQQQEEDIEEEEDMEEGIIGPDQNLEQEEDDEEEEELNSYERKLHQGANKDVKNTKKESTSHQEERVSLTSRPAKLPRAVPMEDDDVGNPDQVFDEEEEEGIKEAEPEGPRHPEQRRIDRQCTTELAFLKEEQFEKRRLHFQPDFKAADFDPMQHFRYCDIRDLPRPELHRMKWDVIDQNQWRPRDQDGHENVAYNRKKLVLERYLRENRYAEERRDGGYLMFVYVIQEMWNDSSRRAAEFLTLPGLQNYFLIVSRQKGYLHVANQFANLVRIALNAEYVLPKKIYKFRHSVRSATLSHEQCAALVARMFFNGQDYGCNFKRILKNGTRLGVEKLRFLFAYFDRIGEACPRGCVSFRLVDDATFIGRWSARKETPPTDVRIYTDMYIEETTLCTQVDFANEHLGGGVLDRGAVQEEIRFLMCPEMFVGMLLTFRRPMTSTQAVSIVGAYVYSSYEGYADRLQWKSLRESPHHARQNDARLRDEYGRLRVETIAIDATQFERFEMRDQFFNVTREMKKATVGFAAQNEHFDKIPVVSGFWGCGAFNGHKPLKFIQQVIAAGIANRPLIFCTFGDEEMTKRCEEFMAAVREHDMTIGDLNHMMRTVTAFIDKPRYRYQLDSPTFFFDYCTEYLKDPDPFDTEYERLRR